MPQFITITDSQTDNVNSKTTNYPGVAGSKEARGHTSSVAERQESQRKGAEGNGIKSNPDETFAGNQSNCADFDSSDSK
jgi:hypothetical protein